MDRVQNRTSENERIKAMFEVIGNSDTLTKAEWLALRGIGGSTVGTILGFNEYQSPYELWYNMVNGIEPDVDNEFTRWGKLMEPVILDWFRGELLTLEPNSIVQRNPDVMRSTEYPFLTANIDGECFIDIDGWGIIECKTASAYSKNFDDGEIPDLYYCQIQFYMWLTGRGYSYMVWLKDRKPGYLRVERNEDFIQHMIAKAVQFWEFNVQQQIPPLMTGIPTEEEALMKQFGLSDPTKLIEAPEMDATLDELILIKEQLKALKRDADKLENELKFNMGDAEVMIIGDKRVTWKTSTNGRRLFKI